MSQFGLEWQSLLKVSSETSIGVTYDERTFHWQASIKNGKERTAIGAYVSYFDVLQSSYILFIVDNI